MKHTIKKSIRSLVKSKKRENRERLKLIIKLLSTQPINRSGSGCIYNNACKSLKKDMRKVTKRTREYYVSHSEELINHKKNKGETSDLVNKITDCINQSCGTEKQKKNFIRYPLGRGIASRTRSKTKKNKKLYRHKKLK